MSKEGAIGRTGKYLLQGWAMMSTLCPICNSALLQLKKTGEIHCPGCDMPVVTQGAVAENPSKYSNVASPIQSAPPQPLAETKGEDNVQPFHSLEEMKREYDARRKGRSQDVSGLLGERMLNGWTLMGASCEVIECNGTPLMSKPRSDLMECVKCSTVYKEGPDGEIVSVSQSSPSPAKSERRDTRSGSVSEYESLAPPAPEGSSMSLSWKRPGSLDMHDAPTLSFARKSEKDASAQIAQKLLVGWALLDEMCKNDLCDSSAPVMRDKEGIKHCLECGAMDASLGKKEKEGAVEVEMDKGNKKERDFEEEDEDLDLEDTEAFNRYAQQRFSAAMRGQGAAEVPRPESKKVDAGKASTQPLRDTGGSDNTVLCVLKAKMSSSAAALQACDHVGDSAQLADLILKLALAAKAVGDLQE